MARGERNKCTARIRKTMIFQMFSSGMIPIKCSCDCIHYWDHYNIKVSIVANNFAKLSHNSHPIEPTAATTIHPLQEISITRLYMKFSIPNIKQKVIYYKKVAFHRYDYLSQRQEICPPGSWNRWETDRTDAWSAIQGRLLVFKSPRASLILWTL